MLESKDCTEPELDEDDETLIMSIGAELELAAALAEAILVLRRFFFAGGIGA